MTRRRRPDRVPGAGGCRGAEVPRSARATGTGVGGCESDEAEAGGGRARARDERAGFRASIARYRAAPRAMAVQEGFP